MYEYPEAGLGELLPVAQILLRRHITLRVEHEYAGQNDGDGGCNLFHILNFDWLFRVFRFPELRFPLDVPALLLFSALDVPALLAAVS